MMHPRNRLLQAFVDRELATGEATRVRDHVAVCDRCAGRTTRMRSAGALLRGAILDIDAVEPASWMRDTWHASDPSANPIDRSTRVLDITPRLAQQAEPEEPSRREGYRFPVRWAALFVFGTAAIGAAALIVRNSEPTIIESPAVTGQPAPAADAAGPGQSGGAIVVQPAGGAVIVQVMGAGTDSFLYVDLTDQTGVTVEVTGDLTPRFRARDGAVDVMLGDVRADVRVLVPASIRDAVIRVGDRVVARVQNGQVVPADAVTGIPLRE